MKSRDYLALRDHLPRRALEGYIWESDEFEKVPARGWGSWGICLKPPTAVPPPPPPTVGAPGCSQQPPPPPQTRQPPPLPRHLLPDGHTYYDKPQNPWMGLQ